LTELARISCYNDLVEAFRRRKVELGLSDAVLDEVAGLASGHVGKVLGPNRERGIGASTFEALTMALAVDFLMIENKAKLAEMRPHYEARKETHVRSRACKPSKTAMAQAKIEILREFGSRGGNARARYLSAERRSAIARKAALAMHHKRREMVAAA
jgi:hypothetical protein